MANAATTSTGKSNAAVGVLNGLCAIAPLLLWGCSGGAARSVGGGPPPPTPGTANVLTYHNDNQRTGQNLDETILTPQNVRASGFGRIGFLPTTGKVDAEPLFVSNLSVNGAAHNVVFVVTEHDLVYAFDADTFQQLWSKSLAGPGETPSDDRGCGQITPEIGITSAPVIDRAAGAHGTLFAVAMTKDSGGNYHQRLHVLDLTNGAEPPGSPVEIAATYPSASGTLTFDPAQYAERAGLLLLNGTIYLAWTSHCDGGTYYGWVLGYSESSLQQTTVLNLTPNGSEGSVWMAGAGMAADAGGNIYLLDANGTFDASLDANGFPSQGDYGNTFLKLSTSGGRLAVADYFASFDTVSESKADEDLGSGGALVLPDLTDLSGATRHLAVGAGKDARIYVVNRDAMGKFSPGGDSAIYQEIDSGGLGGSVFVMPAFYGNTVYYGAVGDSLRAFAVSGAKLVAPSASASAQTFNYPGATPGISANSGSNGIVWAVENAGAGEGGGPGVLHAYDAANLSNELYNSNQSGGRDQFTDNKFITPMIANGKVFIGTPAGVAVFGLLP